MNFGVFAGNTARAYQGYVDGTRQDNADKKQVATDAYDQQVRDANTSLLPARTQAAQLQAQNQIDDAKQTQDLRPIKNATARGSAQAELDLQPGKIKQAMDAQADAEFSAGLQRMDTLEKGQDFTLGLIGKRLANSDDAGVLSLLQKSFGSPMFPATSNLAKPTGMEVLPTAPPGTLDLAKRPITGPALKVTLEDGSVVFMNPQAALQTHQRNLASAQQGRLKEVKAGVDLIDPGAPGGPAVVYSNTNDRVEDENGNWIKPTRGAGAGAGAGAGKAGSAPVDQARKIVAEQFKPDGSPEMARQNTQTMQYLDDIYKSRPDVPPATAAFIAADIAADPQNKLSIQFHPETGLVSQVYQNPKIDSGKTFVIAGGSNTIADLEAQYGRPAVVAKVTEMLGKMTPPGTPQEVSTNQARLIQIARDPALRASYLQQAQAAGKDVGILTRQLGLLAAYSGNGAATASSPATKASPTPIQANFGITGKSGKYRPPTDEEKSRSSNENDGSMLGGMLSSLSLPSLQLPEPGASKSPTSMGDDFESPGARAALKARVQESISEPGKPLSKIEAMRARQLQLIP